MKRKISGIFLIIIMILLLSLGITACDDTIHNVDSFKCWGSRGDTLNFPIKTKNVNLIPNRVSFSNDAPDVNAMTENLKEVSPGYSYTKYSYDKSFEVTVIFNNSSAPATYLLRKIDSKDYDFQILDMVVSCDFNKLAFPFHFMSTPMLDSISDYSVTNGSAFVVNCTLEQLAEFYRQNGYDVTVDNGVLSLHDLLFSPSTNSDSPTAPYIADFTITFSSINENNNLIVFGY